jgi:hypothetical protein
VNVEHARQRQAAEPGTDDHDWSLHSDSSCLDSSAATFKDRFASDRAAAGRLAVKQAIEDGNIPGAIS